MHFLQTSPFYTSQSDLTSNNPSFTLHLLDSLIKSLINSPKKPMNLPAWVYLNSAKLNTCKFKVLVNQQL